MAYYEIEPEVAGGWGAKTEADTTCHPPVVKRLHFEFSGWLGDCLLESFPCFIATESVINALGDAGISGFETSDVEVSVSQGFSDLYPQRKIGNWRWLKPTGVPRDADIAVSETSTLVISERALEVFKEHGLRNCDIEKHQGEQDEATKPRP